MLKSNKLLSQMRINFNHFTDFEKFSNSPFNLNYFQRYNIYINN